MANSLLSGPLAKATLTPQDPTEDDTSDPSNAPRDVAAENYSRVRAAGSDYDAAKQRSNSAQAAMIKAMSDAGERLRNTQFGPSEQEQNSNLAAAWSANTKTGRFGEGMGNVYAQQAANAKATREAELQKQQLLSQYGVGLAGAQYDKAEKGVQDALGAARAFGTTANANQRIATNLLGKGFIDNGDGTFSQTTDGTGLTMLDLQRRAKLAGKPLMIKNADGTTTPVLADREFGVNLPGANGAPQHAAPAQVPAAPRTASAAVPSTPVATPNPAAAATGRTNGTGAVSGQGSTPQGMYRSIYTPPDLPNLPGNVYVSPAFEPAFEHATQVAFSPQNIPKNQGAIKGIGNGPTIDSVAQTAVDKTYKINALKEEQPREQAAQSNLMTAQQMLSELDSPSGANTGAFASYQNDIGAKLLALGLVDADTVKQWDSMDRVSAGQALQKYARQLAVSGLKTTFGGRVTNMELEQSLKSNPNADLTEEAIRGMLKMEVQRDAAELHQAAFMRHYFNTPGAAPTEFPTWYRKYLDPFSNSEFKRKSGVSDFGSIVMKGPSGQLGLAPTDAHGWQLVQNSSGVGYVNPHDRTQFREVKVY